MAHNYQQIHESNRRINRGKWVLIVFLAIGGFFLLTQYRAHLYDAFAFLLLLACPLIHLFHRHGGHGRHSRGVDVTRHNPEHNAAPQRLHGEEERS
ncbi:hypothetical protein GCM10027343_36840 [Noviherbaspirillum agri]